MRTVWRPFAMAGSLQIYPMKANESPEMEGVQVESTAKKMRHGAYGKLNSDVKTAPPLFIVPYIFAGNIDVVIYVA
jgi:hypothetical protein